jgi:DNA repair exonuclease SbcCD nuclease subunit
VNSKKIYFASDFHLGVPSYESSLKREKTICRWLDSIMGDASEIYLVGDIFDFWYEYRYTVPKGTVRLLGKIAEITDSGIPVHFFVGNHDLWMKDYFIQELGVTVNHDPIKKTYNGWIYEKKQIDEWLSKGFKKDKTGRKAGVNQKRMSNQEYDVWNIRKNQEKIIAAGVIRYKEQEKIRKEQEKIKAAVDKIEWGGI